MEIRQPTLVTVTGQHITAWDPEPQPPALIETTVHSIPVDDMNDQHLANQHIMAVAEHLAWKVAAALDRWPDIAFADIPHIKAVPQTLEQLRNRTVALTGTVERKH